MPNTGDLWVKGPDGWTKDTTVLYAKGAGGWKRGSLLYQKTASTTWTRRYERDTTPPAKPILSAMTTDSSYVLTVTLKAPADADVARVYQAWSTSSYPTDYTKGSYVSVISNQTTLKRYAGQKVGTVLYWTFWAMDSSGNVSQPLNYKYTVPRVYVPPTTVAKKGTFFPTDSGSYNDQSNYWRTDNNYVYQGGYDWHGMWFYGTRITGALARARSVTKMTISITRANTVHGVAGAASVYLTRHTLASQPGGFSSAYDGPHPGTFVGTLNRGQTLTFTVPSSWYPLFANKTYKGLGLYFGPTSFTDARYLYALGAGSAASGKVYIEWTE